MKRLIKAAAAILLTGALSVCALCSQVFAATGKTDKTATEIVSEMTVGWNLGNTLESTGTSSVSSETYWGNPKTTKPMIDEVKKAGFNTVRIPVSWGQHTTGDNYTIDSAWMARVKEVVDYCIDNDMYVVLNTHHDIGTETDGKYYYPSQSYYSESEKFFSSVWTQVAEEFADYDYHLIFETMNEPRLVGTDYEWWFNVNNPPDAVKEAIECINNLNQASLDAIRSTGGNNLTRCVMVPGYGASLDGATVSGFTLPTDSADDRLIVSVHAYTPYNFALNANGTSVFSDDIKGEIDTLFTTINNKFLSQDIPVVIGEMSASNKSNSAERVKWAKYYFAKSKQYGIPCLLWDNNVFNGTDKGECHGHLNRSSLTWYDDDFIDAVMSTMGITPESEPEIDYTPAVPSVKVSGNTSDSLKLSWGSVSDASGYEIYRVSGTSMIKLATVTGTSYTYSGYAPATKYNFAVRSYRTVSGTKYYSDYCRVSGVTLPEKPIIKIAAADSTAIKLSWEKVQNADGYVVYKQVSGKWVRLGTTTATSYTYKSLSANTTYKLAVRAYVKEDGVEYKSAYTTANDAVTAYTAPKKPSIKISSADSNSIKLSWGKVTGAKGYVVYKQVNGTWVRLGTTTATSYTYKNLSANTTYKLAVRAYRIAGGVEYKSTYTTANDAITAYTAPKKPSIKISSADSNSIKLSWGKVTGAKGYVVYKQVNGTWVRLGTTTATSYTYKNLSANTTYKLAVRAYRIAGGVEYKSTYTTANDAITAYTAPKKPSIKVASKTTNSIKLSWGKVTGAKGYVVYKQVNGTWVRLGTTTATSYTYKNLSANTTYKLAVRAYRIVGGVEYKSTFTTANDTVTAKTSATRVYASSGSANLYTMSKTYYSSVGSNCALTGYTSSSYPGYAVVSYKNSKLLMKLSDLKCRTNSVALMTGAVGQLGGVIYGTAACGPTAVAILLNSEKNAGYNKDDLIRYCEKYGLNDQGSLRAGGV